MIGIYNIYMCNQSETSNTALNLVTVPLGGRAKIRAIDGNLPGRGRLHGLGLFEGTVVKVVRTEDPMIVQALGSRVALAHRVAQHIEVDILPQPEP